MDMNYIIDKLLSGNIVFVDEIELKVLKTEMLIGNEGLYNSLICEEDGEDFKCYIER